MQKINPKSFFNIIYYLNIIYPHVRYSLFILYGLIIILLSGCHSDPNKIAAKGNLYPNLHYTNNFIITSYIRPEALLVKDKPLFIYLEGDGRAWITKNQLSDNPTPSNPLTLKLAANDPNPNVIYIARPCQYTPLTLDKNCNCKYWSIARYSKVVVDSINQVIDAFKAKVIDSNCNQTDGNKNNCSKDNYSQTVPNIHLIGYSGGAAIALLLAEQRNDLLSIRTLAGNLDHDAVSDFHQTTKLNESLNPINFIQKFNKIPQLHYLGINDQIIPAYVVKDFVKLVNNSNKNQLNCASYKLITKLDHYSGWENFWEKQLHIIPICY